MTDAADGLLDSTFVMVQQLKNLLVARATGKSADGADEEYQKLRTLLLASPIANALPDVVLIHRTLSEFWMFIQPEFRSYDERRKFLREKFEPLLSYLEGRGPRFDTQAVQQMMTATSEHSPTQSPNKKVVFVVYGRYGAAREALFTFLRALHLQPLEWAQAVRLTGKNSPYVGEVLDAGFEAARAVVVLFTPDDEARLRQPFQGDDDGPDETTLKGQPRQNVIFEAGMAMGKFPERTIIVEMGRLRPMSDITGRHAIRLNDSPQSRNEFACRLESAGCDLDRNGTDWLSAGKFDEVLAGLKAIEVSGNSAHSRTSGGELTEDEEAYLLDISRPRNTTAFSVSHMNALTGLDVKYLEMMEHFVDLGLMREGRDFYSLTSAGRQLTDSLWRRQILIVLAKHRNEGRSFDELPDEVTLDDGEAEAAELHRHLENLQDDDYVSVEEITLDGLVDIRVTTNGRKSLKGT